MAGSGKPVNRLDAVYQQVILQHNREPVGFDQLDGADRIGEGHNPVCGDHIRVGVFLDDETGELSHLGFADESCAICTASASLMCQQLRQIPMDKVVRLADEMISFVEQADIPGSPVLEPMQAFAELQHLPIRKRCATLPWETLKQTLIPDE